MWFSAAITIQGPSDDLTRLFDAVHSIAPSMFREVRVISGAPSLAPNPISPRDEEIQEMRARHVEAGRPSPSAQPRRAFARQFELSSAADRVAVLAFHARESGKQSFSSQEMIDWFGACDFPRPANMASVVGDARRKFHYVENRGRNQWTLTTAGEHRVRSLMTKLRPSD